MVKYTQPTEIGCGFDPGSHFISIGNTRIVNLKGNEIDTLLQRKLDVSVMQLKARHPTTGVNDA